MPEGALSALPGEGSAPTSLQFSLNGDKDNVGVGTGGGSLSDSTDSLTRTAAAMERAAVVAGLGEAAFESSSSLAHGPLTLLLLGAATPFPADPHTITPYSTMLTIPAVDSRSVLIQN